MFLNKTYQELEIYKLQEIIDYFEKLSVILESKEYFEQNYNEEKIISKFLKMLAGLSSINSLYEYYMKCQQSTFLKLNMKKEAQICYSNKSLGNLKKLIIDLEIEDEFEKAFNLELQVISLRYPLIKNCDNLISFVSNQYIKRCNYLHGDFKIKENIKYEAFKEDVLDSLLIQKLIFKIMKSCFLDKIIDSI